MTELTTTKGVQDVANERIPKQCKSQKYLLISLKYVLKRVSSLHVNCLFTCVVFVFLLCFYYSYSTLRILFFFSGN